ncbi:hypothetical protein SDC9_156282 [bioreactor metagenome]|uniref:Uncharacterized protein n=1 Tax=bioreactor metagenome TaxID=1076179 RepID=A0A645F8S0_9ZZZZ
MVRHAGIGHDRGRVRIGQHHLVPESAQRFARLSAGVIEFTRLSDDNRPRADNQHLPDVFPLCHMLLFLPDLHGTPPLELQSRIRIGERSAVGASFARDNLDWLHHRSGIPLLLEISVRKPEM